MILYFISMFKNFVFIFILFCAHEAWVKFPLPDQLTGIDPYVP